MSSFDHQRVRSDAVGTRVRACRRKLGWTQAQLAHRAALSASTIARVERGGAPAAATLSRLASALQTNLITLVHGPAGPSAPLEGARSVGRESIEFARAWARLREPLRTALKDTVVKLGELQEALER